MNGTSWAGLPRLVWQYRLTRFTRKANVGRRRVVVVGGQSDPNEDHGIPFGGVRVQVATQLLWEEGQRLTGSLRGTVVRCFYN